MDLVVTRQVNETNEVVNCLHPVIITNPVLPDLLYKHCNYTIDGVTHYIDRRKARAWCHYFPKSYFHNSDLQLEDLSKYYVTDFDTGEIFPIYIAVPCGHCEICKGSKVDAFAHRCELETQCYRHLPYFVTLTYRDHDYPKFGLSVKDAQDFLKRLRSRLSYAGFNDHFRYVLCGEYGSNTHRAHLHVLIWNLYPFPGHKYFKIRSMICDSWSHGHIYMSIVSPSYRVRGSGHGLSKPEDCFRYVAKYLNKDCYVPSGCNRPFLNTSRLHGGIGAPFLDRHALSIRKSLRTDFKYLDIFTGKVRNLVYCRYNLNRLFPTYCQSVPLELRNSVRYLCKVAPFVRHSDGYMDIIRDHFKDNLFFPVLKSSDLTTELHESYHGCFDIGPGFCSIGMHEVWKNLQILIKYKDFDFRRARELADARSVITYKLFEHKKPSYLVPIAARRKKYVELSKQREFF